MGVAADLSVLVVADAPASTPPRFATSARNPHPKKDTYSWDRTLGVSPRQFVFAMGGGPGYNNQRAAPETRSMKAILSVALCLFLFNLSSVFSQVSSGAISGTVVDTTGAAIPGAGIRLTNQGSGQSFSAVSSNVGSFTVSSLAPGLYTVSVSLISFKTFVATDVKVNVGETYSLVAVLEVGDVTERITVTAGRDIVNTTETQISKTISKKQIADLPLNGLIPSA